MASELSLTSGDTNTRATFEATPEVAGVDAPEESLLERFKRICSTTPLPNYEPAKLDGATEEELEYLVQNDAGEIFLSPKAIWKNDPETRPIIKSAMRKALQFAYQIHGLEMPEYHPPQPSQEPDPPTTSFRAALGLPEWQRMEKYINFTWATSESKKALDDFNAETGRIRVEREAKEAAEEAAVMARVNPPKKPRPQKQVVHEDPVVWAAQEEAAASSVLRELRARGKKGLWGSRSTKLKPEAAAEMARARVAAAAAAAVMRDVEQGAQLVRADEIDSQDVFERMREGATDSGFYPMHAQAFRRAMSLGTGSNARGKKRVAFAEGTVFAKKK